MLWQRMHHLLALLHKHPGDCEVRIHIQLGDMRSCLQPDKQHQTCGGRVWWHSNYGCTKAGRKSSAVFNNGKMFCGVAFAEAIPSRAFAGDGTKHEARSDRWCIAPPIVEK